MYFFHSAGVRLRVRRRQISAARSSVRSMCSWSISRGVPVAVWSIRESGLNDIPRISSRTTIRPADTRLTHVENLDRATVLRGDQFAIRADRHGFRREGLIDSPELLPGLRIQQGHAGLAVEGRPLAVGAELKAAAHAWNRFRLARPGFQVAEKHPAERRGEQPAAGGVETNRLDAAAELEVGSLAAGRRVGYSRDSILSAGRGPSTIAAEGHLVHGIFVRRQGHFPSVCHLDHARAAIAAADRSKPAVRAERERLGRILVRRAANLAPAGCARIRARRHRTPRRSPGGRRD